MHPTTHRPLKKAEKLLSWQGSRATGKPWGFVLLFLGGVQTDLSQYEKALEYYEEALTIRREIGDRKSIAETLNETGIVYSSLGRYEKALSCHEEAMAIDKEIANRQGVGADLAEIGIVYCYLARYEKALAALTRRWQSIKRSAPGKTSQGTLPRSG